MTEKEAIEYLKRRYWVVGSPCQSKSAGNVRGEMDTVQFLFSETLKILYAVHIRREERW